MDSSGFPENSRESRGISPENCPSQETHLPNLTSLDVLAQVASEGLDQELGFETDLDGNHCYDFPGKQTENQGGSHGGDTAETSAAGEGRVISGGVIMSEAERREELERKSRFESYKRHQEGIYYAAKTFARKLHSDMNEYHQDHKKQRIGENVAKKVDESGGPFHDAMEAIKKRGNLGSNVTPLKFCAGENGSNLGMRVAPSLLELSLRQAGKYAEDLVSLQCIPDGLRSKIASVVSSHGEVNARFMKLLVKYSPTEIRVKNCTNLVEKDLTGILHGCDTERLRVLELELCGRSMTEHVIGHFLSRSPNGFQALVNVCLKGAFSLTDKALALISRSAPLLQRVNLSDCSLLTENAIQILADSFGSTLKGLNIEGCQGINPSKVLGNLKRFKSLNSLSIAGLEGIDDDFVLGFLEACGSNLTTLVLSSCRELTDESTKGIGRYCPNLSALDVSFLDKLTDLSLQYIANGCSSLSTLKCCRNHFSDEGVAAFLEVSGSSLNVLSLNNVRKVFVNTVISLAKVSKKLQSLDLSWCRNLTDEDLRLVLCSCTSLRQLKLFGCSQVTGEFLTAHLGLAVQIIGLRMTPLLEHLNDLEPVFQDAFVSE
ncbi:PREDICTED: EIN3-binding F-box protein 2-like [Tarenaya hassleriana]|uniref:EIN3-binding F-box protein 2-like n=1 Tax=Tarenaya hassleriana TaxID=28532 RepID=UPI00053CA65D|nr:PREDICTED: EIN3-binding F-box protein 2-like [Tarenaya hassleriana]